MALDRTWYNTLVDDDGSGMTGSVWDKEDVNQLMQAIDAEVARLDAKNSTNVFTPTLSSTLGGVPVYSLQQGIWSKSGTLVYVAGRIATTSKGSIPDGGTVIIAALPFVSSSWVHQGGIGFGYWGGINVPVVNVAGYINPSTNYIAVTIGAPAGTSNVVPLYSQQLMNATDFIFGGCYKID